jgi:hypothetical protein
MLGSASYAAGDNLQFHDPVESVREQQPRLARSVPCRSALVPVGGVGLLKPADEGTEADTVPRIEVPEGPGQLAAIQLPLARQSFYEEADAVVPIEPGVALDDADRPSTRRSIPVAVPALSGTDDDIERGAPQPLSCPEAGPTRPPGNPQPRPEPSHPPSPFSLPHPFFCVAPACANGMVSCNTA